ncbi:hypothetical protein tb265_23020 [Gemmatimonadetes bacterium T265]|nr:hypothetical protein tb265_23020 [Gemmatimonadetes bacterium T265]
MAEIRVRPKPRSRAWLWLLLVVVIAALVAWYLYANGITVLRVRTGALPAPRSRPFLWS